VSFVKSFLGITCLKNNCIADVAGTISTIFISALITRAINNVVVMQYEQAQKDRSESGGIEPGLITSPLEEQYILKEYDTLLVTLTDYAGLIIQFGYTTLFVAAFPLAPTLAFVSAYIQIRVDGWKHCQAYQRPNPTSAEDIGVWQDMLEVLGVLSVIYNFSLIFLTSHYLIDISMSYRWIMNIACVYCTITFKYVLASIIDDIPEEVAMQLERQDFLTSKVLGDLRDEDNETDSLKNAANTTNITIAQTDYDWVRQDKENIEMKNLNDEGEGDEDGDDEGKEE